MTKSKKVVAWQGQRRVFVIGWVEIGRTFGTSGKQVRQWYSMGAPILCIGGKPVTDPRDLWLWLLEHRACVEEGGPIVSAASGKAIVDSDGERALLASILAR